MVWLPCPNCGDDRWHPAGKVRKPLPCGACGWWAAVVRDTNRWRVVEGLPGRTPGYRNRASRARKR